MKQYAILFLTLSMIFLATSGKSQTTASKKLPSVEVKSIDGKVFNISNLTNNGKPIVICVWETTCKPCLNQLDAIAEVYSK